MIEVQDLKFFYQQGSFRLEVPALDIFPAEKVAIMGPSGAGKTTLLHLLAGILVPRSGSIRMKELDLAQLPDEDRRDFRAVSLGLVFQEFELLEYLNLLDNILLPYRISPLLELDENAVNRARDLARAVGLTNKLNRYPHHLSQGERQRIAVCRALVTQPAILFGDEPTGNLDPKNRDLIMEILFGYSSKNGAPLIVVTHDHDLLPRFNRIINIQEYGYE